MTHNSIFLAIFILRARVGSVSEPRHNLGHVGARLLAIGGCACAELSGIRRLFMTLTTPIRH